MVVDDENAKAIYIFAPGSPFEEALNKYMSNYHLGIDPNNPLGYSVGAMSSNSSLLSIATPGNSSALSIE